MIKISLFIPTLNAGDIWPLLLQSIKKQSMNFHDKLIIDSGSIDSTTDKAKTYGFHIVSINKENFNHGGTRNQGVDLLKNADIIVFLTQDVILSNEFSIEELIKPFSDPNVGCVYGRQLPHKDANPLAQHARIYNYPPTELVKDYSMITKLGFKVSFISNAFAAYRTTVFKNIGIFPTDVIIAEDNYLASLIINSGSKIVYAANAKVYHSHNYSPWEEFQRYFDLGVFHKQNSWIRENFGKLNGEGVRYLISELKYIFKKRMSWIVIAVISNGMKFLGFKLGLHYRRLPKFLLKRCSMHKN